MAKTGYKVIIAGLHEETNSFNSHICGLDGTRIMASEGKDILLTKGRSLEGLTSFAQDSKAEIVPVCYYSFASDGPMDHCFAMSFAKRVTDAFKENPETDAILLALHGATQTTEQDDGCGLVVETIRSAVGDDVVISVALDLHANVTPKLAKNANYVCGFQEYPHIDQAQTGIRAARLAFEHLDGKPRHTAYAYLPMIVPACGYTTRSGVMKEIMDIGHKAVAEGKVSDFSVFQMQPWLDVNPAGSAVLAIGDDENEAKALVSALAKRLFSSRDSFWPKLETMDDVIAKAAKNKTGRPLVLVDFSDSPGAGAKGDNAKVLNALVSKGFPTKTVMHLSDKNAVAKAFETGAGNTGTFTLGESGKTTLQAKVVSLHKDGRVILDGPAAAGQTRNLGSVAVLEASNVTVIVCENVSASGDPQSFRHFGVEFTNYQMVCVKANTSFRAAMEPLASEICMVDTLGLSTARLAELPFKRISKDFYPFSKLENYKVKEPAIIH